MITVEFNFPNREQADELAKDICAHDHVGSAEVLVIPGVEYECNGKYFPDGTRVRIEIDPIELDSFWYCLARVSDSLSGNP
jgi:hypothetical protein